MGTIVDNYRVYAWNGDRDPSLADLWWAGIQQRALGLRIYSTAKKLGYQNVVLACLDREIQNEYLTIAKTTGWNGDKTLLSTGDPYANLIVDWKEE